MASVGGGMEGMRMVAKMAGNMMVKKNGGKSIAQRQKPRVS